MMIDHLSYSSIQTFLTCPEHWRRKYIAGEPVAVGPPLLFGKTFHKVVSEFVSLPRAERSADLLLQVWDAQWRGALVGEGDSVIWGDDEPAAQESLGRAMLAAPEVTALLTSLEPLVEPWGPAVEKPIVLDVPDVPVPIVGFVDLVTQDGAPAEWKTSAALWPANRAALETQPLFYLAALAQEGLASPGGMFRHFVVTKTKTPRLQVMETRRTQAEQEWLFGMIRAVWRSIESEQFYPNPAAWFCNERQCHFWSTCRGCGTQNGIQDETQIVTAPHDGRGEREREATCA